MATAARTESTAGTAGTAVATTAKPGTAAERIDATRAALKERNALVAAIRGTQWGRDAQPEMQRAIAHYCFENGLDPVRHVELLGGRIYLTAEFYDERGAALIRAGTVRPDEPDFIHVDERLTTLAASGDGWAKGESERRMRLRIQHAVPEKAKAAVIQRFWIHGTDTAILGVNWCGGVRPKTQSGKDADPIGEAEPTKTALTRARRRAWKQIADVIPGYGELVKPAEATARIVSESLPVSVVEADEPKALVAGNGTYDDAPAKVTPAKEAVPATQALLCGRCNEPHAYKDGEDLGNESGTCFRFAAAKEG
jgi:hypothetical protein